MMADEQPSVWTPSEEFKIMQRDRALPTILQNGLEAIQDQSLRMHRLSPFPYPGTEVTRGHKQFGFIVQQPAEADKDFVTRLELLRFYNFYWAAAGNVASMPFTKSITWSKETPQAVKDWESNVETTSRLTGAAGRDLRAFARDACTNVMGMGLGGLFVNKLEDADRPYMTFVPGSSIREVIFRSDGKSSRPMRMKLHIGGSTPDLEAGVDARGVPWCHKKFDRVMVLYDGDPAAVQSSDDAFCSYEIYDREDRGNNESPWRKVPTQKRTPMRPQRAIPMTQLYAGYDGPWFSRPVLRSVAQNERVWINMRSDLDYIIKTSCVPMWDWAGASEEDEAKHGVLKPANVFRSENPQAHLRPAEFTGSSMTVAAKELEALLREIEAASMTPFMNRPTGGETATGKAIDTAQAITRAQAYAIAWADSFSQAMQFMAIYERMPQSTVEKISMSFYHDFGISIRDMEYAKLLTQAYLADPPKISPERWFTEMKRMGAISDDADPVKEAQWVADQEDAALKKVMAATALRAAGSQPPPRDPNNPKPAPGKPPVAPN